MSVPLWINSGPCPMAEVLGTIEQGAPTLQGYWEFNGNVSSPPVLYTQYTLAWSGAVYTQTPDHPNEGAGYPVTQTQTWTGTSGPQTTATPDSTEAFQNPGLSTGPTEYYGFILMTGVLSTTGPSAAALTNGQTLDPTGGQFGGFLFVVDLSGATVLVYNIAAQSTGPGQTMGGTLGTYAVTAGSITVTLVNPDTEAAALARVTAWNEYSTDDSDPADNYGFAGGAAGGLFSLWETRQDIGGNPPAVGFGYQAGTYQIALANLLAGINYTVTVQWEQRTAAGDGSGNTSLYGSMWADADTDVITLVASGSTQTTAAQALPLAQGYQKRVKSIAIAGACA